jgi:CMP-N-acetylneuraminic acid synthetase
MTVVAVVPVKASSERVKEKNFREFYEGKSLFDLLIGKLRAAEHIDKVYVSSNARELKSYVEDMGCHFILRGDEFCNNIVPWSDVIAHVAASIPEADSTTLAWCHTTSPLFEGYDGALSQFKQYEQSGKFDGLVSVAKLSEFVVNEKRQPLNYSWGPWHRYSQYLDKLYTITGALFVAKKRDMVLNRYVISKNPAFFEVPALQAIDVDTPYDFELAKLLMSHREHLSKYA